MVTPRLRAITRRPEDLAWRLVVSNALESGQLGLVVSYTLRRLHRRVLDLETEMARERERHEAVMRAYREQRQETHDQMRRIAEQAGVRT